MKKLLLIGFLFLLSFVSIKAQDLKLFGKVEPGSAIIGEVKNAENIYLDNEELQMDSSGTFLFGFDRNAKGTHYLKVKYLNGNVEIKKLELTEREYETQRLNNIKQDYVTPPKKVMAKISREREKMKLARAKIGQIVSALFKSGFERPVDGGRLTSVFGSQRVLNGVPKSPHNGLDIAAPKGTPVHAMADGVVQIAGDNFYYNGNFVLLDHGQGLNSVYLHMRKLNVKTGQKVKKGDVLGWVGTTGRSTGPHLHWGVQWYKKRIDPQSLLNVNFEK
jgi:murein DD-endopeptidase MepM/ murein hydrolase activator NlpD